jgi:NifB/MoaA-like Fe-S oxidoreductase
MPTSETELAAGQLRRHRRLRTEAVYRILELLPNGYVMVEVVSAPGLESGKKLKLTVEALEQMQVVARAS